MYACMYIYINSKKTLKNKFDTYLFFDFLLRREGKKKLF
jgi:hypothetical protein